MSSTDSVNNLSSEDDNNRSKSKNKYQRPRKRYKQMFTPHYQPSDVSELTRRRWDKSSFEHERKFGDIASDDDDSSSAIDNDSSFEIIQQNISNSSNETFEMSGGQRENIDNSGEAHTDSSSHPNLTESTVQEDNNDENDNFIVSDFESSEDESEEEYDPLKEDDVSFKRIMFPQSGLTVSDVILMISATSLKLGANDEGKLILGEMVKVLAGKEFDDVSLSKHMMNKCFSSQQQNVNSHYYCNKCYKTVVLTVNVASVPKNKDVFCMECKENYKITSKSSNYFLSLDLKYEVELLLSNPILKNDLLKNIMQPRNTSDDRITDIQDGFICKNIMKKVKLKDNEYVGTVNVSTDGVPLTNSGKKGFWPVQVFLNDFSPKNRFRYILLSGLMLTEKEPESKLLNLYVSTVFVEQMKRLTEEGIYLLSENGDEVVIKLYTHACIVDAIGRRILQNRIQFNGYCGCSWCYQKGEYIKEVRGIRYVTEQDSVLRTNESHKSDVTNRNRLNVPSFRGVKGECCLSKSPYFDMAWSFAYEYLHGLLGVVLQIWNEWKSGTSEYRISKAEVDSIEKNFLKITPIREIHRLPRSGIIKGTAKPKGSELKSWLLCYSLPCLKGILDEDALRHYSLLVGNSWHALTSNLSNGKLQSMEEDLLKFVVDYEQYYEDKSLTFNVHTVRHMVESIRKTGPLMFNSAFPPESNIYDLKKLVTGPNGMDKQIARKYLQKMSFTSGNIASMSSSKEVQGYCYNLFQPTKFKPSYHHVDDAVLCGKGVVKNTYQLGNKMTYKKCIFDGTVYHSDKYVRAKKTNDNFVKLKSGEFGKIVEIVDNDSKCYLQIVLIKVFVELPFPNVSHILKIESEDSSNKKTVPITDIQTKVVMVEVPSAKYLCIMPNTIEIQ